MRMGIYPTTNTKHVPKLECISRLISTPLSFFRLSTTPKKWLKRPEKPDLLLVEGEFRVFSCFYGLQGGNYDEGLGAW